MLCECRAVGADRYYSSSHKTVGVISSVTCFKCMVRSDAFIIYTEIVCLVMTRKEVFRASEFLADIKKSGLSISAFGYLMNG